jgi:hypothetical protein
MLAAPIGFDAGDGGQLAVACGNEGLSIFGMLQLEKRKVIDSRGARRRSHLWTAGSNEQGGC